jgi:hypothetical protein
MAEKKSQKVPNPWSRLVEELARLVWIIFIE